MKVKNLRLRGLNVLSSISDLGASGLSDSETHNLHHYSIKYPKHRINQTLSPNYLGLDFFFFETYLAMLRSRDVDGTEDQGPWSHGACSMLERISLSRYAN